jgi:hypothetical protein
MSLKGSQYAADMQLSASATATIDHFDLVKVCHCCMFAVTSESRLTVSLLAEWTQCHIHRQHLDLVQMYDLVSATFVDSELGWMMMMVTQSN